MLFNSITFLIFLPIVFILYWFVVNKNLKLQNFFILVASYVFYGWWDYRFLSLLFISSVIDYIVGIGLGKTENGRNRKLLLITSLVSNLGLLVFFKYFNFFIDNFIVAMDSVGIPAHRTSLNIVLPVGISFYTFQTMSYTIDIYRRKLQPTSDFLAFFSYVSFFPQLVAGPIERAVNLLPQFYKRRNVTYDNMADGLRQMLLGFFKKIVIADNCAPLVQKIFDISDYSTASGATLFFGAFFFAFQIYGDFSGYSDIAIGLARLFGFELMRNFNMPYFSRDIAEFWRKWHISLSTWFRDYLYIPLGGSRVSIKKQIRNTLIVFLVSGFWHGANWTFIVWGLLNALYFLPVLLSGNNRKNIDVIASDSVLPGFGEIISVLITFFLTCIAWIYFRSADVQHANMYIYYMFNNMLNHPGSLLLWLKENVSVFILLLLVMEFIYRKRSHSLEIKDHHPVVRWAVYVVLFFIVIYNTNLHKPQEFIYFQF